MQENLYETEQFVYNKVPVRIFNHYFEGSDIYTALHWHRNLELNLVTSGRILYKIDALSQPMEAGDWNIVNSGEMHSNSWISKSDHFEGIAVQISKSLLDSWLPPDSYFTLPACPKVNQDIRACILKLGELKKSESPHKNLSIMSEIYKLLELLGTHCTAPSPYKNSQSSHMLENIKAIIQYLDRHYTENLSLHRVASQFHYSDSHLSRLFKKQLGYHFYEYLQSVRLMNALNALKAQPNMKLLDCAMENGFPNAKSFIETFKKTFGCTPSQWQKQHVEAREPRIMLSPMG